ncbi:uncharacterized protein LOC117640087 [Thrips palmi]|uniref:Uncharacterized protein LOC117640087 n=1 Tax=Thrips palmi TaxID=161013 RepID=A0A6P8Y6M1_THRPL|nr:uncharacterized protein LOC117640087 [Thrips palmi]
MFRDKHHDHLHSFAKPTIFPDGHQFLNDSEMAWWDVENGTLCFRPTVDQRKDVFEFKSKNLVSILKPRSPKPPVVTRTVPVVVSPSLQFIPPADYGFLDSEIESLPEPGSSKRKRPVGAADEEEIHQAEKCPRRETLSNIEEPSSCLPRRSMECSGARVRSPKRVSIHQIASMAGVTPLSTPYEFKLARKAQEIRQMAHTFRRKLEVCRREKSSLKKLASARFVDMVDELQISPATRQIVKAEMKNFKRKKKGRTWTADDKLFALAIFKRSSRAYRFLREYIMLPSENTLKTLLMKVPLEPGISETLISLLSAKVNRMEHWEKNVVVSFDETFLRGNLFFNESQNSVEGFENYGHRGRTNRVADHALVFMVQGINSKWTFPIAYFLVSKTCPSTMLKLLLTDVVKALFSIGLNVLGSISDQGPTNVGAINQLKEESGDSIFYTIDDHKLVHLWDMPHILKNVRNNLLSSNLEFSGGVAKWRHLVYFFKFDESLFETSNLTYKHLNPQGRDKMKVSLAAQALSASVSKAIKTFQALRNSPELEECLAFALLCDQVDLFFDLCNGPRAGEKVKETRTNVTPSSLHHEMWGQISDSLKKWTFIRNSDGQRHVPPCVHGWIQNIQSFQALWKKVENCGLNVLKLRHFNQDPVENLFCLVRQCAGSASDLTTRTFTAALKTTLVTRFSSPVRDKNCLDDESFFISDLRQLVLSQEPTGSSPVTVTEECLIRGDTPQKIHHYRASDPLERQGPTKLLAAVMPTITREIKCDQCLSLICTEERRQDTLLITNSSLELFPSVNLVSLFMKALSLFNQKWMRLLYKKCIKSEVVAVCNPSDWARLFCPAHIESDYKNSLLEEVAVSLIKSKIREVNQKFKEKVVRRSRQVMASDMKNSDGLRVSEEVMHPSDLQLLLGPGFVKSYESLLCVTRLLFVILVPHYITKYVIFCCSFQKCIL